MTPVTLYRGENSKQEVLSEPAQNFTAAELLRGPLPFRSGGPNCEADGIAGKLFGTSPKMQKRTEPRAPLRVHLWLTSLHRPGVFEIVLTENVSSLGIQMVAQHFWEPAEPVLVSSPPGFLVRGSIVYSKKRPSGDQILGLKFAAPVEPGIATPENT